MKNLVARCAVTAALIVAVSGCERVASHPSLPPEAQQLVRESVQVVRDLSGDVAHFVAGFGFQGQERHALDQLQRAMFGVLSVEDSGDLVWAAIEIKRAQACLAVVGIESSGVIDSIANFIYRDEAARAWWDEFEVYMESVDTPDFSGVACDHARPTI